MLDRISASLLSLCPSERRVGQMVLDDVQAFMRLSIGEVAARAGVSKPTIVRFCRSVGYNGFADLKRKLLGTAQEGLPFIHGGVDADDTMHDIVVKVVDSTTAAFLHYRSSVKCDAIEDAIALLVGAHRSGRRIEVFGMGNSGGVAQDVHHKFLRLGVKATALNDSRLQIMSASTLVRGDCVLLISNSGRTRDILDSCMIAKGSGATTIALTSSGSPLAEMADIHLAANHLELYECHIPAVSRLLHMVIIDILAAGLALRLGGEGLCPIMREVVDNLSRRK
ncbi:MAG: MurR/RpiR family transcriptional regulator [Rhodoferax sp.]